MNFWQIANVMSNYQITGSTLCPPFCALLTERRKKVFIELDMKYCA